MQKFTAISALRTFLNHHRASGRSIGLVPTMGALHEGHLSLIRHSLADNALTVCSIYVNPTQFNNTSDLASYPRTLDHDMQMLEDIGCDAVFVPNDELMYPNGKDNLLTIDIGSVTRYLEGKHRPGHFNGVALVVSKLFNIVQPERAYFGQKDLQQFAVIKKLTDDLSYPIALTMVPTVRAPSGLALSSRNKRLTSAQLSEAAKLYSFLVMSRAQLLNGQSVEEAVRSATEYFSTIPQVKLEYFAVVNSETFEPIRKIVNQPVALCVAVFVGEVRLIDNLLL